ncbi:DUF4837 domain-containing protein [Sesbania bispinosa]|nr:DUF4837 domain-containing protein [Sesbania bispinosa]
MENIKYTRRNQKSTEKTQEENTQHLSDRVTTEVIASDHPEPPIFVTTVSQSPPSRQPMVVVGTTM